MLTSKHIVGYTDHMLTFAVERLREVLPEVQELWALHWAETEGYRDELGYNPDVIAFVNLDNSNMFRLFTARDERGLLMGQLGFIVFRSRHTQSWVAGEDFLYFRKEARKGLAAVKFIRYALADLKALGIEQVTMSSKLANDIEPMLKRVGFDMVAKQYNMNLKGAA